ncbi:MAG: TrkA domain protein [uncultured Sulfurovum sp.]|uniref:TrkA domain protein n=1 Tax=uncultured Sulfurovum sp. TaxID=269237 RepID=A0A6S6STX7_9BACT|nr:MAG: TrkA domain protein [uncultured Sulfurovum sp.]
MKNVLILASGAMAKNFVQWVGTSRIDTNEYYITCTKEELENCNTSMDNINYMEIDPTSYMRIKNLMEDKRFTMIFIVMENRKEAEYAYKNVRMITTKSMVVFVSKWDDMRIDDDNLTVLNVNEVMAANLYEKLPNVPLIAKNIGLGQGEIMEILVPFGSSFAYRHIRSVSHRKWKVVAIYRKEKQILADSSTMIQPNDRLIVIGNPLVLEEVYKKVNRRQGVFPEPFGKNLYLLVNMQQPKEDILIQINEAIFLSNQLQKSKLYIRLIYSSNLALISEIRALQTNDIQVLVTFRDEKVLQDIDFDISQYEVGLLLLERGNFFKKQCKALIMDYKRPIYLFGEKSLYNIKQALILIGDDLEMESLSTSIFDFSESLGLKLTLCDYSPDGDFQENEKIVEHYESLSRLYNFKVDFKKKQVNPIRELLRHEEVLHVTPFVKEVKKFSIFKLFSTKSSAYIMSIKKHPQLLIPVDN